MKKYQLAALLAFAWAMSLSGQARDTKEQIKAKCDKYLQTSLPSETALIAAPKTWPECDSPKLYAGIGVKVDYVAARKCAWAERLAIQSDIEPKYTVASVVGGSAMLAVLYANGEGVEQNKLLAGRFACEAEIGNGLKDIEALPPNPDQSGTRFKYCDEVRTTMEIGFCVGWDTDMRNQVRLDSIKKLSTRWPAVQRDALLKLVMADNVYSTAHSRGEIDLSGSGRAIWELSAESLLRERFLAALKAFERGQLPRSSTTDSAHADVTLNRIYQKSIESAEAGKSGYGAVQPEGIRNAERAWLKYRDVWLTFAKLRYPTVHADALLTLLTDDRIEILKDTLCEMRSTEEHCRQEDDSEAPRPLP